MFANSAPSLKPPSRVSLLPVLRCPYFILYFWALTWYEWMENYTKKWLKCFWYRSCQLAHGAEVCEEFFVSCLTPLIWEKNIDICFDYFSAVSVSGQTSFCKFHPYAKYLNIWNVYSIFCTGYFVHLDIILVSCWDYATRISLKSTRNLFNKFTTHPSCWLPNGTMALSVNLWQAVCLLNVARLHREMLQTAQQHAGLLFPGAVCDPARRPVFYGPVCDRRAAEGIPASETSARSSFNTSLCARHHILGLWENTGWWKQPATSVTCWRCLHESTDDTAAWAGLSLNPARMGTTLPSLIFWTLFVLASGPRSQGVSFFFIKIN